MEEWERRVAQGQSIEVPYRISGREKEMMKEEREPAYRAGDGLPTLTP